MKKTIFAVSDIHGCATALKTALAEAGFDKNNPDHLLVVCGDCFDRGRENRAVYLYLDRIKNKILIKGNHDAILERILLTGKVTATDCLNGTDETVREFFRNDYISEYGILYTDPTSSAYKELFTFLCGMRDYFETENYVFTHGWLPTERDEGDIPHLLPDWRYASSADWYTARWTEWQKVYPYKPLPEGKTVVCGHRRAKYGCKFDSARPKDSVELFRGERTIALDGEAPYSGKVNVLKLEDEEVMPPSVTEMSLINAPFQSIKSGEKRIEMRLFDEKRRAIRPGDIIAFRHAESGERLLRTVTGLYRYGSFGELAAVFPHEELGFPDKSTYEISLFMLSIYGQDAEKYGALAIQLSDTESPFSLPYNNH